MNLWDRYLAARPDLDRRPAQDEMVDVLRRQNNIVVAAPTGTGKTAAAIMGRIMWLLDHYPDKATRPTLVIATSTKALQDQYKRELVKIKRVLREKMKVGISYSILMGRNSYACKFQPEFSNLSEEDIDLLDRKGGRTTDRNLTIGDDDCGGSNCPFYDTCYYYQARNRAKEVRIVVTNHRMYLQDKMYPAAGILPENHIVVFDECHELYDNLTNALSFDVKPPRLPGDDAIARVWDRWLLAQRSEPSIEQLLTELRPFNTLARQIIAQQEIAMEDHRKHKPDEDCDCDIDYKLQARCERFQRMYKALSDSNYVLTFNQYPKPTITLQPIRVDGWAAKAIWNKTPHALISATPGTTDFLMKTVGTSAQVHTVPEAFDYSRTLLHVATGAPDSQQVGYRNREQVVHYALQVWKYIEPMVRATKGGVLILSPNREHYEAIYEVIQRRLGRERPVRMQSADVSVEDHLRWMKTRPGTILLGTKSLFTGIDLPGDALQLVILTKVPYAKPDSLIRARQKALGYFATQTLPALLTMSQAFGRINRTPQDWGAFVILDKRAATLSLQSQKIPGVIPHRARRASAAQVIEYMRTPTSAKGG